jgi:hypothetical protein
LNQGRAELNVDAGALTGGVGGDDVVSDGGGGIGDDDAAARGTGTGIGGAASNDEAVEDRGGSFVGNKFDYGV